MTWLTVCVYSVLSCDPPPAGGTIKVEGLPENNNPLLPAHFIKFSCDDPGKRLTGSSVLTCGKDGQWNEQFPSCEGELFKIKKIILHTICLWYFLNVEHVKIRYNDCIHYKGIPVGLRPLSDWCISSFSCYFFPFSPGINMQFVFRFLLIRKMQVSPCRTHCN